MRDTTKHTPTPWKAISPPVSSGDTRWVVEANNDLIARIPWEREQDERHANAALIVRAVNAYEPMRKALEGLVETYTVRVDGGIDYRRAMALKAARAALALAEKE